jgi:hypothetical protein
MHKIHDRLKGGDRRSIGAANAVADLARKNRRTFDNLVEGLGDEDPLVRMRSADALEKASAVHPDWLSAHKRALLAAMRCPQPEVRWHLAQMAPRLRWRSRHRSRVINWLARCLSDESLIVRASALEALAEIAASDPNLRARARSWISNALASTHPSMRARARKLLGQYPALRAQAHNASPTKVAAET